MLQIVRWKFLESGGHEMNNYVRPIIFRCNPIKSNRRFSEENLLEKKHRENWKRFPVASS